jgi:beta-lactamase regulating signal transducer with metallopeptidase domain
MKMYVLENLISQEAVQRIGWTLIHFIWQGALIAFLFAGILLLLRKQSSNLRYAIACAALMFMIAAPAVTFKLIGGKETFSKDFSTPAVSLPSLEMTKTVQIEMPAQSAKPITHVKQSLKDRLMKATESALPYVVVCWGLGVFILSIWYLGGWTQLQKLRRQMVSPVSEEIKTKLNQLSKILAINRAVEAFQSVLVNVPTVIGHFKPVILLPASTLIGLSGEQIEAILTHELAHIKRCDYLVNIFQTVVEILGFYHPAVWWVSNKIRQEREHCCDDIAVKITGDEVGYAQALTTIEEIRFSRPELAVAASGGNLLERIKRLLVKNSSNNEKAGWLPSAIMILVIAGLLFPMMLTLSSCEKQKLEESMNAKLNRIDIDTATKEDVIKVFGEPEKYMWESQVFDKDNLPSRYVMIDVAKNFNVFIGNNHIVELRFEGPSDYVFGDGLVVGSPLEKAFEVLGKPKEIVDGQKNEFLENVFYKNIDGKKGYGYYAVPEKHVRIWVVDDRVKAIYLTRSNYFENKPSRKLKDSELPEGSIIDANGNIVDKIDYPFVDHPEVIGEWKSVDYVRDIEKFNPDKKQWIWGDLFLKEMSFNENGTVIAKNGNAPNGYREKWTKGLILYNNDQKTASQYIIKEINGSTYMFYEWKSGDYTFRHQKPSYYVLKKVGDRNIAEVPPHPPRPPQPLPPPTPYEPPTKVMQVYEVNKIVNDFPDDDFSSPEAAYAAINRVSANDDQSGWQKVSVKKLADRLAAEKKNGKMNVDAEWSKVLLNAQILEVRIWKDKYAMVIAKLPQEFSSKKIKSPIDLRSLEFENGKWLNSGNNRVRTIEEARAMFDDSCEYYEGEKERNNLRNEKTQEILKNPQILKEKAAAIFEKLKNADYNQVLASYKDGKWEGEGWKKFDFDYMVNRDWGSFRLWLCKTFKDNPIQSVELGEIFLSDRKIANDMNSPAIPYKLTLKDGGILQGDLYFVYWDKDNQWQAAEGIDWHLQKDPIKKPQTNYVTKETIKSNFEILDVNFEPIHQGKNVVNIKVKNNSGNPQILGVHIYTRSVDYGPSGVGWGTVFFDSLKETETKICRFVYKIQGPVTANTYIRVKYYNPATEQEYNYDKPFFEKQYSAKDLPFAPVVVKEWLPGQMGQEIWSTLNNIQTYIKKGDYEKAWELFSDDYQKSEYQRKGFEAFKQHMEPKHPLDAAFHWDKKTFVMLKFLSLDADMKVINEQGGPILEAGYKDQIWHIKFVHVEKDVWKIDDIIGYTPKILEIQEQDAKK